MSKSKKTLTRDYLESGSFAIDVAGDHIPAKASLERDCTIPKPSACAASTSSAAAVINPGCPQHAYQRPQLVLAPGLGGAYNLAGNEQVQQARDNIGIKNHHAHGGCRCDVAGIVHVEYRHRGQGGVG